NGGHGPPSVVCRGPPSVVWRGPDLRRRSLHCSRLRGARARLCLHTGLVQKSPYLLPGGALRPRGATAALLAVRGLDCLFNERDDPEDNDDDDKEDELNNIP
ncbi:MAG: hypothetical protein GXP25_17500, partial [Planctomycetes bacterium]|nr:hypothetical protein [Planctomycetota bacterium]